LVAAVVATLLFFANIAYLMRSTPRRWRRFACLSLLDLALGAYSAPLRDILVFVIAWCGVVTLVAWVEWYESSNAPKTRAVSTFTPAGRAEDLSDLPREAKRLIAEIITLVGSPVAVGTTTSPVEKSVSATTPVSEARFTLSEALARYVPDTIAAFRVDRDRLGAGSDTSEAPELRGLVTEFLAQLARLRDRIAAVSAQPEDAAAPALTQNGAFLLERFGHSDGPSWNEYAGANGDRSGVEGSSAP
jgi:hypothetical protein